MSCGRAEPCQESQPLPPLCLGSEFCFALRQPPFEGSFQRTSVFGNPVAKGGCCAQQPHGACDCAFALAQLPDFRRRIRLWCAPTWGSLVAPPWAVGPAWGRGQQGLTWCLPPFLCTSGWGRRVAPSPALELPVLGQFQRQSLSPRRFPSLGVRTSALAIMSPTPVAILQGQVWSVLWGCPAAASHRDLGGAWVAPSREARPLLWQTHPHHQTTQWLHVVFVFPNCFHFCRTANKTTALEVLTKELIVLPFNPSHCPGWGLEVFQLCLTPPGRGDLSLYTSVPKVI